VITPQEKISGVQRIPNEMERAVTREYQIQYDQATGYPPHGLHYIPFPSEPETVPVWFYMAWKRSSSPSGMAAAPRWPGKGSR
jgi:hypothetical protein